MRATAGRRWRWICGRRPPSRALPVEPGSEYATIVSAPGKAPGRRVLLVCGRDTWATQAAAEYITNLDNLVALERRLGSGAACPDAFEVLLRVEIRDEQPVSVRYMRHHALPLASPQ